jgi:hypothetical protein
MASIGRKGGAASRGSRGATKTGTEQSVEQATPGLTKSSDRDRGTGSGSGQSGSGQSSAV